MTKHQKNTPVFETPIQGNFEDIIDTSYVTYASAVIEDRALPDARDGLKPSQRRILVAMNDLRLYHNAKHLKCAKICGDVSGNYHPHGEQVIYPTLVGMAQSFNLLVPLIDPQGNFGSVDGDPPAALRYVEARLTRAGEEMIADLSEHVVPYKPNFDDRLVEPEVLPAKIPNLLINGASGIAVGYATNLPPHNYLELTTAIDAFIKNPSLSVADIMKIMPGPDFPGGGYICGSAGIKEYYETGKGAIDLEGTYEIVTDSKGKETIVITAFPDGGSPEGFRKEIKDLVEKDKISGISDCLNYSSSKEGTKVVVEVGRNGKSKVILNNLLKYTCLRKTYNVNNTVLVAGKLLEKVPVLDLLKIFVDYRRDILGKKFSHELQTVNERIEVLDGLLRVVSHIDKTIKIIRASSDPKEAEENLIKEKIISTSRQAKAVLGITLSKLTKLEQTTLQTEKNEKVTRKSWLENIIKDKSMMDKFLVHEQKDLAKKIAAPRKTKISGSANKNLADIDLVEDKDVVITVDVNNYIKTVPVSKFNASSRGSTGGKATLEDASKIETSIFSNTHDTLYCFTNTGTVHQIKVYSLPEGNRGDKGQHISKFLTIDPNETIVSYLSLSECADDDYLVFANSSGVVKRTLASYYTDLYNGCIAIKLKDKDNLVSVLKCKEHDDVFLATEEGLSIRFCAEDISVTNRNTQGCWGINLSDTDRVIGAVAIPTVKNKHGKYDTKDDKSAILTVTSLGFGKRTLVDDYLKPKDVFGHAERQSRGGKGKINIKLTPKIGKVVKVILLGAEDEVLVSTSDGKNARVSADEIRTVGRNSSGVSLVKIKDKDTVVGACRIPCSV
jgi:DNA gyrase subunit A